MSDKYQLFNLTSGLLIGNLSPAKRSSGFEHRLLLKCKKDEQLLTICGGASPAGDGLPGRTRDYE
jgi:hypothetical protein